MSRILLAVTLLAIVAFANAATCGPYGDLNGAGTCVCRLNCANGWTPGYYCSGTVIADLGGNCCASATSSSATSLCDTLPAYIAKPGTAVPPPPPPPPPATCGPFGDWNAAHTVCTCRQNCVAGYAAGAACTTSGPATNADNNGNCCPSALSSSATALCDSLPAYAALPGVPVPPPAPATPTCGGFGDWNAAHTACVCRPACVAGYTPQFKCATNGGVDTLADLGGNCCPPAQSSSVNALCDTAPSYLAKPGVFFPIPQPCGPNGNLQSGSCICNLACQNVAAVNGVVTCPGTSVNTGNGNCCGLYSGSDCSVSPFA